MAAPPPSRSHNPYPPPGPGAPYPQPPELDPSRYKYAGLSKRGIAFIIDAIICAIPIIILSIIFAIIAGLASWALLTPFSMAWGPFQAVLSLISLLIGFFYFYILEHRRGETIGKRIMKVRVVREDYRMLSTKKAAIRSLFRMFYFINGWGILFLVIDIILILVTDRKQRLGDIVAHTVVIKSDEAPPVVAY